MTGGAAEAGAASQKPDRGVGRMKGPACRMYGKRGFLRLFGHAGTRADDNPPCAYVGIGKAAAEFFERSCKVSAHFLSYRVKGPSNHG